MLNDYINYRNNCKFKSVGIHAVYIFQDSKYWETFKGNIIQRICNKNMALSCHLLWFKAMSQCKNVSKWLIEAWHFRKGVINTINQPQENQQVSLGSLYTWNPACVSSDCSQHRTQWNLTGQPKVWEEAGRRGVYIVSEYLRKKLGRPRFQYGNKSKEECGR